MARRLLFKEDQLLTSSNPPSGYKFVGYDSGTFSERQSDGDVVSIGGLPTSDWVDYSATSTVVGWSSFTSKVITYKKVGKQVFVSFGISGTSNATTASFTLPDNATILGYSVSAGVTNNGTILATPGVISLLVSTNTVNLFKERPTTPFTNTGTKTVQGQFFYFID